MPAQNSKGKVLLAYSGGLGEFALDRGCFHSSRPLAELTMTSWLTPDTSCILAWLIEEGYEVAAFMADVGQEEVSLLEGGGWRGKELADAQDFEAAKKKAMDCGAVGFFLEDLKKEFIEELIYREYESVGSLGRVSVGVGVGVGVGEWRQKE